MADLANIGLSEDMRLKLKDMHEGGVFSEMKDGYRLAVSIAIKFKFDVENRELPNRDNMYDVGGIDDNFILEMPFQRYSRKKKDRSTDILKSWQMPVWITCMGSMIATECSGLMNF